MCCAFHIAVQIYVSVSCALHDEGAIHREESLKRALEHTYERKEGA